MQSWGASFASKTYKAWPYLPPRRESGLLDVPQRAHRDEMVGYQMLSFCFVLLMLPLQRGKGQQPKLICVRDEEAKMFGNTFQYLWVVFRKERGISEPLLHASASAPQRASSARTRPVISKPSAQDSN